MSKMGRLIRVAAIAGVALQGASAHAVTLEQALAAAYANNPSLNASRASLRATDESVPQAKAGNRPTVSANGTVTGSYTDNSPGTTADNSNANISLSLNQPLFSGFTVKNSVKQSEANVSAARSTLKVTEQSVLLDTVTAYMDVVRDAQILGFRRQTVAFLNEQLRAARDRFDVGEGTRTDVAQAESRLSQARSDVNSAEANLAASRAAFTQVTGLPASGLKNGRNADKYIPRTLAKAIDISQSEHPSIQSAIFSADAAAMNVKVQEGGLLPTVSLQGSVSSQQNFGNQQADTTQSASIVGRVDVPIYQGGAVASRIREAKHNLGAARINIDVARDSIRASVISNWSALKAARASITSAQAEVRANTVALEGIQEERRVGQRTTLDVLDQRDELTNSQIVLAGARRDRVVAGYSLLSAIGRLNSDVLALGVTTYRPKLNYVKTKDKWFGLRTTSGQ